MTHQQVTLIKNSWRLLRALDGAQLSDLFYSKLFFDHPELRSLFPSDMSGQHQKLIATLQILIARLDQMATLEQEIAELGRRHQQYGVRPKHYGHVGAALLWTFERVLGSDWTPLVAEAWQTLYKTLAEAMLQAAENRNN
ncbi:MAG: hypothetical protein JNK89_05110 [Saprospiraceae bacterium]|nr:hypothetical protein [Saprospiraceae bacterium]